MNFAILTEERNQKINIKHIQRKHPASFNYLRAQSTQNKNSSKNKLPTKWLGLQFEEKKNHQYPQNDREKKHKTVTYLPGCQFRLLFTLSSSTNLVDGHKRINQSP
ncbi:hypothetical protein V8G54_009452 [Vigna mungo]|uniref:Uncharacterized protein n=1 Tax=Vigna mungo TaxID=3915 RepID=A0AAQ3NUI1_VIGMU